MSRRLTVLITVRLVGLLKKSFAEIHLSILCHREIVQIKCGHLEHLSCTLTVTSCDQAVYAHTQNPSPGRICELHMRMSERTLKTAWKVLVRGLKMRDCTQILKCYDASSAEDNPVWNAPSTVYCLLPESQMAALHPE